MFKTKYFWFNILLILSLVYFCSASKGETNRTEGFSQAKPFVLKTDSQAYDDFYAEIYDIIHVKNQGAFLD